jgi:3-hydroxyisobutyrate dehydrogenase-like beta-hydroxyacid dehydrogenase
MAENLQKYLTKEGYPPLTAWNRTASRADPLKTHGAIVANSVEDAVSKVEIIFISVYSFYCDKANESLQMTLLCRTSIKRSPL